MYYEASNDFRNYLAHYGVKGMKWGRHLFGDDDERRRVGKFSIGDSDSHRNNPPSFGGSSNGRGSSFSPGGNSESIKNRRDQQRNASPSDRSFNNSSSFRTITKNHKKQKMNTSPSERSFNNSERSTFFSPGGSSESTSKVSANHKPNSSRKNQNSFEEKVVASLLGSVKLARRLSNSFSKRKTAKNKSRKPSDSHVL